MEVADIDLWESLPKIFWFLKNARKVVPKQSVNYKKHHLKRAAVIVIIVPGERNISWQTYNR